MMRTSNHFTNRNLGFQRNSEVGTRWISTVLAAIILTLITCAPVHPQQAAPATQPSTQPAATKTLQDLQSVVAKQAALVTEFEVNGLKVLVKRREGSLTVAAGLFIKGGSRNITAENAGIEALMLDAATEGSVSFPRARMRDEQSRMGTVISSSANYDYSVMALRCTRPNF